MNVLIDRHHAGLYYSLQLLFEDRLGVDVYTPVGHEWWDEGVWQFGACFGDDRLAQQYLMPWDGVWKLEADGLYTTIDGEYPDRPIYGITYEDACEEEWAFVMATVQENHPGFHRFAQEKGARSLYQVGNTGQFIDWSLDSLVLASAEMPFPEGAPAFRYHQEMRPGAYPYVPDAGDPQRITSFVNLFSRIDPHFSEFNQARRALEPEGFAFELYGHEQEHGYLAPVTRIGEKMSESGWGWHDKPVGDGFGHVVHGWASAGRPLIGHSAFYLGKLAEPFWVDGETCIDLSRRSLPEAVALVREISADTERHGAMCAAMRAAFEKAVDYDVEAETIRGLLGL